ncbi:hypothetical protein AB0I54_46835 [Streptomyces sp. NPDC050625]|uniref:hypothetical protein n=1 Tax=Streptomyces sp. NPDC050625 TaxID=3154629 RepID=UPI0034139F67
MTSPTPLLVVPELIWTIAAGASVITPVVTSARTKRQGTSSAWDPFTAPFPAAVAVAALAYAAAALAADRLSFSAVAFSLWPAMAASALHYTVSGRIRRWPNWADYGFAAIGALLYGALPI